LAQALQPLHDPSSPVLWLNLAYGALSNGWQTHLISLRISLARRQKAIKAFEKS
jgi:hypothetical protein